MTVSEYQRKMSWIKYTILLFALQAKLLEAVSVDMSEAEYAQYLEFANSQLDSYGTFCLCVIK